MDMINDSKNPSPAHLLDPSPEQMRSWANAAVELMAEYLGMIRNRRVYPYTSSRQIRERLDSSLPKEPVNFDELLHTFRSTLIELSRHNGHPRMFGYVQAPGTAIAAFADLLSSTLNANLTAWRSAPAAVEIERLTIDWIKQIIGFDRDAAGLFVSGGSMANMAALAAARRAKRCRKFKIKERSPAPKRCVFMLPKKLIIPSPKLRHCSASDTTTCV